MLLYKGPEPRSQCAQDLLLKALSAHHRDSRKLIDAHHDGVHRPVGRFAVHSFGIGVEVFPVIQACPLVDLRFGDQALTFAGSFFSAFSAQRQEQERASRQGEHAQQNDEVFPGQVDERGFRVLRKILCQRGVDGSVRYDPGDLTQDGIQERILPVHREAIIHFDAGGNACQVILFADRGDVVESVAADQQAVRLFVRNGAQAARRILKIDRPPLREMIQQEHFIVGISYVDGNRHPFLLCEGVHIRLADHRGHVRTHHRGGYENALKFPVIVREIYGKYAVHLSVLQRLHSSLGSGKGNRLEFQTGVFEAAGGSFQKVLQRAGQFPRFPIFGAESQIIVPVSNPNRSVVSEPGALLRAEIVVDFCGLQVFGIERPIIKRILIQNSGHGVIQLTEKLGACFADREENIGGADLTGRYGVPGIDHAVKRRIQVDAAEFELGDVILLRAGHLHDLRPDAVCLRPIPEVCDLHAALVRADLSAVNGGKVLRRDLFIVGRGEEIVILRTHRLCGEQHVFRALVGIGDIAHQVDSAILKHLQQLRPAPCHIFVCPAGISGDLLLIIIGVAGAPPQLVRDIERRFIPPDADGFFGLPGMRTDRQRKGSQNREREHERDARSITNPFC